MSKPSVLRRVMRAIWNGITRVRLVLSNLLFLAFLAVLYYIYVGGAPEPLPARAALLLNPMGSIVDQRVPTMPVQALLGESTPEDHEVLLRDVIDAIDYARDDPAINSLVMELDYLMYVGISKSQEIARALQAFRASGKPVVAVGDYYTQDQYLLASQADTVITDPLGAVALEGFASYRNYFAEALDKLSVNMHVFRAGEHKSAMEPFVRNDMSAGEKAVTRRWLNVLWNQFTAAVETQRKLAAGAIDDYVNGFPQRLAQADGNAARTALQAGLVDRVLNRREANEYLVELVGASDDEGLYEAVPFEHYVLRKRRLSLPDLSADQVAVITAQGNMLPGEQPPGSIGGDSLAQLIRSAAEQDGVKAIVLRVNSGGGSMFAAEIIRQQILDARAAGMPVVVSMGAVAASGGYYIATAADEIWATPSTITGSIGVFAAFPTFEDSLQRLGVHTDGVGTTSLAGSLRLDRPLNPALVDVLNSSVNYAYRRFLQIVAEGRNLPVDTVDTLAQGRVWSAPDALEHDLIDGVGSLEQAVAAAAGRAGLEDYETVQVELPRSASELILERLAERMGVLGRWAATPAAASLSSLLRPLTLAAAEMHQLQDPGHLYLRCIACSVVR